MPKKSNFDFEKSLKNLEQIADKLDSSALPLNESLELFEKGISLAKDCENHLKDAELKVEVLTKSLKGNIESKPFEGIDDI